MSTSNWGGPFKGTKDSGVVICRDFYVFLGRKFNDNSGMNSGTLFDYLSLYNYTIVKLWEGDSFGKSIVPK